MEPEGSLPSLQESSINLNPEPEEPSLHHPIPSIHALV
jgi:hypothetical protein